MSFTITKTNGDTLAVVADGTTNTTVSSLTLIGKNYFSYGVPLNNNFVRLLENFASGTAPANPLAGQLWYDSTADKLKVYRGTSFVGVGTEVSTNAPTQTVAGDLWYDSTNQQLKVYTGTGFKLVGPVYTLAQGESGVRVDSLVDNTGNNYQVVSLTNAGLAKVTYSASSFIPFPAYDGQSSIAAGLNLYNANLVTTGQIYFGNKFTDLSSFPDPVTYDGMVAVSAASNRIYYSNSGVWNQIIAANNSTVEIIYPTEIGKFSFNNRTLTAANTTGNITFVDGGNLEITGSFTGNVAGNVNASSGSSSLNSLTVNSIIASALAVVPEPTAGPHATTKTYVDNLVFGSLNGYLALAGGTMLGAINMNNNTISGANLITTTALTASGLSTLAQVTIGNGSINNTTVGQTTPSTGKFTTLQTTGIVTVDDTTNSTSSVTGAVTVAGGVGVGLDLTVGGSVTVSGDLTVQGTTTTVNSVVVSIKDPAIELGTQGQTFNDGQDRGIAINWGTGTQTKKGFFGWRRSTARFAFITDAIDTGGVFTGTLGAVEFGNVFGANASFTDVNSNTGTINALTSNTLIVNGTAVVSSSLTAGNNSTIADIGFNSNVISRAGNIQINSGTGSVTVTGTTAAKFGIDFGGNAIGWYKDAADLKTISFNSGAILSTLDLAGNVTYNGDITAFGSLGSVSDRKLKENFADIPNALELVMALKGQYFTLKSTGKRNVGFIAQEIEQVIPEVVSELDDGTKLVHYANLVGILAEAIKQQQSQIEQLKKRLDDLTN